MIIASGTLQPPDYFILVGYFVLMLGIGAFFYRRMQRMKDYFSGGNRIPWWLSGVSYYMSCFSVFAFIAYAALAYEYGWLGVTVFWFMAPATLVSVVFFSRRWRRARIDSPVEYLETRYGPAVRQLFAWQNIPVRVIDDALKLVSIGLFVSEGLGIPMGQSMLWSGLIMLAYTLMGGLWAVTVTDFVQFIVLMAAVLVVLPLSLDRVGGIRRFIENAPEGFFQPTHADFNWVYIGSSVFLFCLAFSSINWSLIQRYYCVPRERDAMKAGWLVFALNVLGPPVILLPAMAAQQFLPPLDDPGKVYPALCVELLPAGMLGLVIAAMFSATMSMLSSDYNVCAGVLTNDVYRRYIRPLASQRELVLVGRLMTLLIGVLSLGAAFVMMGGEGKDLFRTMVKLFSIATAPVAIPMLAGLLSRRVTETAALSGFLGGLAAGLLFFFLAPDRFELWGIPWAKENALVWVSSSATLLWMVVVSALDPLLGNERTRIEAFHQRLQVPVGDLPEDREAEAEALEAAAFSPFGLVGLCTVLIGVMLLGLLPFLKTALAFRVDAIIGTLLAVVGIGMVLAGRRATAVRSRATIEQD